MNMIPQCINVYVFNYNTLMFIKQALMGFIYIIVYVIEES